MIITIPATPPSINQYQHWHWAKKRAIKAEWVRLIWGYLNEQGIYRNSLKGECFSHVHISSTITFTTNRRRDPQNYASTLYKFLDDALVQCGVIPDDTAEYISHDEPVLRVGDKACTVIEIRSDRDE